MTVLRNPKEALQQIEDAERGVYEVALCTYGFIKVRGGMTWDRWTGGRDWLAGWLAG